MTRRASVILTVADHEQNGFVHLAKWSFSSEDEARKFITIVDREVADESEPDIKGDAFTFILDLWDGKDMIDNGERLLPMQVAMSLAPEQVRQWLDERPDPDSVMGRVVPAGPLAVIESRAAVAETNARESSESPPPAGFSGPIPPNTEH